ncbi:MAG TPA: restriction endonuclease subunit S, partial [candidate division Zixibacteria bacterium]|nr:restriction endonuclease subunit S [candidate division Zixibacteria bacterium]
MDSRQLPERWCWAIIRELGEWFGGGTPSKNHPEFWEQGTIPWISPKDMKVSKLTVATDYITEEAVRASSTTLLGSKSLLMVVRSGILRHTLPIAVNEVPVTLNQDMKGLVPGKGIVPEYIAYALMRYSNEILQTCSKTGTTVNSIEFPLFREYQIPLASTSEQQRIVEKLDELLTNLDAGVAALERVKSNLKRFQASVLKAAVEGRLTERWREEHTDVEPADELLKRILAERRRKWEEEKLNNYEARGKNPPKYWRDKYKEPLPPDTSNLPSLPKGWCWANIDLLAAHEANAIKAGPFGSSLKKSCFESDGYKVYGQEQVIRNDPYYGDYYINEKKYNELISCSVKPGDILISLVGTIGRLLILPDDVVPG